mmetsp:Transcript_13156/g.26457  ORF Transcript_13156/g.26457 Transcript_13156/m.26457 type:complete len:92 (-) Transcript_13156:11-286(-)
MGVMAVICWALFGILEIGNIIEEPFTATVGFQKKLYVLPLTEAEPPSSNPPPGLCVRPLYSSRCRAACSLFCHMRLGGLAFHLGMASKQDW